MSYQIEHQKGGFVITFKGKTTLDDILEVNGKVHGHELFDTLNFQVVDFYKADVSSISESDVLIPAATDYAASMTRRNLNLAVVIKGEHATNLACRYLQQSAKMNNPWKVKLFTSLALAMTWARGLKE